MATEFEDSTRTGSWDNDDNDRNANTENTVHEGGFNSNVRDTSGHNGERNQRFSDNGSRGRGESHERRPREQNGYRKHGYDDDRPSSRDDYRRGRDRFAPRDNFSSGYADRYPQRDNFSRGRGDRPSSRDDYGRDYSDRYSSRDDYNRGYGERYPHDRYSPRDNYNRGYGDRFDDRRRSRQLREDPKEPNETLGIFNLSYNLTQEDFDGYLNEKLVDFKDKFTTKLVIGRYNGKCKGYGFVHFDNIQDSTKAKEILENGSILGQQYRVVFSIQKQGHTGRSESINNSNEPVCNYES